jgi:hypothetical protein
MDTVLGWVFAAAAGLVILVAIAGFVLLAALDIGDVRAKSRGRREGMNRCVHCGSKLTYAAGRYAAVCDRCGRTQPWALEHAQSSSVPCGT